MKKVIILNWSPRKNFNIAKLLKAAEKGCGSVWAEVEYFNLYDLNYKVVWIVLPVYIIALKVQFRWQDFKKYRNF